MTTWVRYEGPGHLLRISDEIYLGLGSAAPVDDELAKTLLDSPDIYGVVVVIKAPVPAEKPDAKASTEQKEKN